MPISRRCDRAAAVVVLAAVVGLTLTACGSTPPTASTSTATVTSTETSSATTPSTKTTTTDPTVDSARYASGGNYYFTSPSKKWNCGIIVTTTIARAGCHGPFSADVPTVPSTSDPTTLVRPNTVYVVNDGQPARFQHRGDPAYSPDSRATQPLPYGAALSVGPITCSVDEQRGVSCDVADGHGFTVSTTHYQLR